VEIKFRAPHSVNAILSVDFHTGGDVREIKLFDRETKIRIRVARRPQQPEAQLRGVRRDDARAELRRDKGRESRSGAELQHREATQAAAPGVRKPLKRRDRGDARRPHDGAHGLYVVV